MILEGIFKCTRCGAVGTELTYAGGEGTVCLDEETCQQIAALEA